jgi:cytochrome c-type biogenesis protein CcmH
MKHTLVPPRTFALIILLLLCAVTLSVSAQDSSTVTDDQVNAIAKTLYCPVCENITLDTCATAACADWRDEIRLQLEAGRTENQIVADFVQRFGDRVVGTPQDSVLRSLSLVTPWIIIAGVLLIVGKMVFDHRRKPGIAPPSAAPDDQSTQKYEDLLEQDLRG